VLYVSFDFQVTVIPLAYNIMHLLTDLVSFAFVIMKLICNWQKMFTFTK